METYYVSAYVTYVRDYKVEADSKEEAESLVAQEDPRIADHYEEELYDIEQVFKFTEQEDK